MSKRKEIKAGLACIIVTTVLNVAAANEGAAAGAAQPWRNAAQPAELRVEQLLKAMSFEQKVALVSGTDPADYRPLAPLGIPALTRVDASSGLRGDRGVTAFPVPLALAATFNPALAAEYGKAIGQEARAKGWNVILGPTVDVARDGLTGRLTEGFGEDPLLSGTMGAAVAGAMQQQGLIAMAKHYTAYQTERDRLTMNVVVSDRALHEVYNVPFYYLIEKANIASLMGSYPKVNGKFMLENAGLINLIKDGAHFKGYMATDFMGGQDGIAQFNAGVDSWSLQPVLRRPEAFAAGKISAARLDQAVRRMLWALFSTGTFDQPLEPLPVAVASTAAHQALAVRVAEDATVLLKNENKVLPLAREGTIAVIGAAGKDALTSVMWSSYVDPGQFLTPLDAIAQTAGAGARVVHAQGSLGDVVLPTLRLNEGMWGARPALIAPDGSAGWQASYFGSGDFSGDVIRKDIVAGIDITDKPWTTAPAAWSVKWVADYLPEQDGLVRLAASVSGHVRILVDGKVVVDGMRSTATNFPGAGDLTYPLQGVVRLSAGRKAHIEVEYSSRGAFTAPRIQIGWQQHSLIPEAVALARQARVAVVFVNQVTGEEMDRDNYELPGDQNALIDAVSEANPNTVVVLNTGGAVKMPWLAKVKGVLQMWYPGSATGQGIANVLFGDAEPGGRLPVSFLADESQGPRHYRGEGEVNYAEGVFVGYKYLQQYGQRPLFPFGYGLSYATFQLDNMHVQALSDAQEIAAVSVRVRNTGSRSGATVVQVYGGALPTAVATPKQKLIGFAKVYLAAGAEQVVRIPVERRLITYWDEAGGKWVTPGGKVVLSAGFSSENLPLHADLSLVPHQD